MGGDGQKEQDITESEILIVVWLPVEILRQKPVAIGGGNIRLLS